ncbi:MAG: hypothetical protein FD180_2195 [Planctomycetota bacterium]|nr:MAG: hypothetical protein FD180_2195 [Planctomycetota bacterium]
MLRCDQMRDRINLAFASLLLFGVAVVQIVRVHTTGQSAWKGGGFGMFATSDSPDARILRCVLIGKDGEHRVPLPKKFSKAIMLTRTVPSEHNVTELCRAALALEWVREDYVAVEPLESQPSKDDSGGGAMPGEATGRSSTSRIDQANLTYRALGGKEPHPPAELLLEVQKIRLEVWRIRLDSTGTRFELVHLRSVTLAP